MCLYFLLLLRKDSRNVVHSGSCLLLCEVAREAQCAGQIPTGRPQPFQGQSSPGQSVLPGETRPGSAAAPPMPPPARAALAHFSSESFSRTFFHLVAYADPCLWPPGAHSLCSPCLAPLVFKLPVGVSPTPQPSALPHLLPQGPSLVSGTSFPGHLT